MTYILIMIVLNNSGSSIATQSIRFNSNSSCLQAIQKLIDMERGFKVKATCITE